MLQITNGKDVVSVTRGAFEEIFEPQGYTIMKAQKGKTKPETGGDSGGDGASDDQLKAIVEKPLSQWTKNEIKTFADAKGIDLSGTKNIQEAKDIIKDFMAAN